MALQKVLTNLLIDGAQTLVERTSTPSTPSAGEVTLFAEDDNGLGTLHFINASGEDFEVSRDRNLVVRNTTGSLISKGDVVYINGSNGTIPTIALAKADVSSTMPTIGVAYQDIANNSNGHILIGGIIKNVDTSPYSDGDILYVSDSTAGAFTTTEPTGTSIDQKIAVVVKGGSVGGGIIFVKTGSVQDPTLTQTLTNKTINTANNTITINEADIQDFGTYLTDITSQNLVDLADVAQANAQNGEVLLTDGTTWFNSVIDALYVQTGTFADARISESSVTQHQSSLSVTVSQVSDFDPSTKADLSGGNTFTGDQNVEGNAPSIDYKETDTTDLNVKNILNNSEFNWQVREDDNTFVATILNFDLVNSVIENKWVAHFDNGISFDSGSTVLDDSNIARTDIDNSFSENQTIVNGAGGTDVEQAKLVLQGNTGTEVYVVNWKENANDRTGIKLVTHYGGTDHDALYALADGSHIRVNGFSFDGGTNVMNDYEKGTFNPEFKAGGGGTDPTVTYDVQNGAYIRIGDYVLMTIVLGTSSVSGGTAGANLYINTPFTLRDIGDFPQNHVVCNAANFVSNPQVANTNPGSEPDSIFLKKTIGGSPVKVSDLNTGSNSNDIRFVIAAEIA